MWVASDSQRVNKKHLATEGSVVKSKTKYVSSVMEDES